MDKQSIAIYGAIAVVLAAELEWGVYFQGMNELIDTCPVENLTSPLTENNYSLWISKLETEKGWKCISENGDESRAEYVTDIRKAHTRALAKINT